MCCDTVEAGSEVAEFEDRAASGRLWSLARGNGPAHFWYDVCTVFPNFRAFNLDSDDCEVEIPEGRSVCEDMRDWVEGEGTNWFGDNNVSLSTKITDAIEDSMAAMTCADRTIWGNCVRMERLQSRV